MPAGPDESGEFQAMKIFGGKLCIEIHVDELRKGDFIEFYRDGTRVRRVKAVHRGRKHSYVQFEKAKYNPFKSQRLNLRDVKRAWRPTRRKPKPALMKRHDYELGLIP